MTAALLHTDDGAVHKDKGAVRHKDAGAVVEARRRLNFSLLLLQEPKRDRPVFPNTGQLERLEAFRVAQGLLLYYLVFLGVPKTHYT